MPSNSRARELRCRNMDVMKYLKQYQKGILLQLPAVFIGAMIAVIILFSVVLPIVNTGITSASANLTGYAGALQVSQQVPLILVLTLFVSVAVVILRAFSAM